MVPVAAATGGRDRRSPERILRTPGADFPCCGPLIFPFPLFWSVFFIPGSMRRVAPRLGRGATPVAGPAGARIKARPPADFSPSPGAVRQADDVPS